jgi:hypothetical protein
LSESTSKEIKFRPIVRIVIGCTKAIVSLAHRHPKLYAKELWAQHQKGIVSSHILYLLPDLLKEKTQVRLHDMVKKVPESKQKIHRTTSSAIIKSYLDMQVIQKSKSSKVWKPAGRKSILDEGKLQTAHSYESTKEWNETEALLRDEKNLNLIYYFLYEAGIIGTYLLKTRLVLFYLAYLNKDNRKEVYHALKSVLPRQFNDSTVNQHVSEAFEIRSEDKLYELADESALYSIKKKRPKDFVDLFRAGYYSYYSDLKPILDMYRI